VSKETLLDDGDGPEKNGLQSPASPNSAPESPTGQAPLEPVKEGAPQQKPVPEQAPQDGEAPTPLAPIIVKKITIEEGGHHGGAWKVAYADFVTAMMAFFLLLWLLGASTDEQRKGLADYFTPTLINYRDNSAGADGMLGGSSITDVDNYPKPATPAEMQKEAERQAIKEQIEAKLKAQEKLAKLVKQVRVVRSPLGIRIDLVDDAEFSMFALGTTVLVPEARQVVSIVAEAVSVTNKPIVVRGHTDSLKWRPGVRTNNWSLSSGRAEATRQALIRSGISERRFSRIEGVAYREPLIPENPADPRNRRISIILEEVGGIQQ
jgi:chemotaxis protein MotB